MGAMTIDMSHKFSLRPVTSVDREFLLRVYESSREIELAMVPWDAKMKRAFVEHQFDSQTSYYSDEYPNARHDIILSETNEPIGRLYINRTDHRIAILDVIILPEYRRNGFGSSVISTLLDEARVSGKAVQVYVENFNPSQQFFITRGFAVEDVGEINLRLVWRDLKNLDTNLNS